MVKRKAGATGGVAAGGRRKARVATTRQTSRTNDPEKVKRNILDVATKEFSSKGLSGARIDEIAAKTHTSKRMVYYYFGGKEGLYVAVLEDAYSKIRAIETQLDLDHLDPEAALRRLVGFTFDYEGSNQDFINLVMNENIHKGQYLSKSKLIRKLNVPAINEVKRVYERGCAAKVFRSGLDPIDIHWAISALCFFNVSNRHTFSIIFDRDMTSAKSVRERRENVIEQIVRFVRR
jgi:AcrR family transcriptional regulator